MRRGFLFFFSLLLSLVFFSHSRSAGAATLMITPSSGAFVVGDTFSASLIVDTEEEEINAFEAFINFPPDRIQVISDGIGTSITSVWISQPKIDNQKGTIELRGGIPRGITTSGGRIATFLFRSKKIGQVLIKPTEISGVFKNDGRGTDILTGVRGGIYSIILPAPQGPSVVSDTHPDESRWYREQNVSLRWGAEGYDQFSFLLNDSPIDIPDNTAEGSKNFVAYRDLPSGTYYFHIKGSRGDQWGGVSHGTVNIDAEPPAEFPLVVNPRTRTTQRKPVISFTTTDQLSGINRYELKVVSLAPDTAVPSTDPSSDDALFIEIESPYILPELDLGRYDVIVRAYDNAGNYREITEKISIVNTLFVPIAGKGLQIRSRITIPWFAVFLLAAVFLAALIVAGMHIRRWHIHFHREHTKPTPPQEVKKRLAELEAYRRKYGHLVVIAMVLSIASLFLIHPNRGSAQEYIDLSPPLVTVVSRDISNEDIFYVGGNVEVREGNVMLFLQNARTGEAKSYTVTSSKQGEWFYRHNAFLDAGEYIVWAQSSIGNIKSPPSPQEKIVVRATAFQFGGSRLSYESLYAIAVMVLSLISLCLIAFIVYHGYHARRKQKITRAKLGELEESLKRGFAMLRRDIERELALHREKRRRGEAVSHDAEGYEKELVSDLEKISAYIGKEIWEVEKLVSRHYSQDGE